MASLNTTPTAPKKGRLHRHSLRVDMTPLVDLGFLLNTSNYHIGDINLFYVNIRQNVAERIAAFVNKANGQP